jgi:cell wall-associated NlpC family hydrolase
MGRDASNKAARRGSPALAVGLAVLAVCGELLRPAPARADYASEERDRVQRRAQENVWQEVFGQRVVREARRQLGRPYVWGEKSGKTGFDCSGYTAYVFHAVGVELQTSAFGQFQQGVALDKAALRAGDLVFFLGKGSPLHVGIYEGDGRFLHAPGTGKVIESSSLDSPYFSQRFIGGRRVTPTLDAARRPAAGAKPAGGAGPGGGAAADASTGQTSAQRETP